MEERKEERENNSRKRPRITKHELDCKDALSTMAENRPQSRRVFRTQRTKRGPQKQGIKSQNATGP